MIILKVTKKQAFTLSLEDTYFEKPQGAWGGGADGPLSPSRFRVEAGIFILLYSTKIMLFGDGLRKRYDLILRMLSK